MAVERWLFGFTVRSADVLVVQTRHVAENLARAWKVPHARLRIIPNALSSAVLAGAGAPEGDAAELPPRASPTAFTIVYPSRYYPYKNHMFLLETARVLRDRGRHDAVFVVTVDPRMAGADRVLARIRDEGLEEAVVNIGEVQQTELNRWYRRAGALVFPSLAETFGNALLEGMAHGLPLLVADRAYAHDVCGEAALFFPPDRPERLADLVERTVDDADLRADLSRRSRERLGDFPTWDEVARDFVRLAEELGA